MTCTSIFIICVACSLCQAGVGVKVRVRTHDPEKCTRSGHLRIGNSGNAAGYRNFQNETSVYKPGYYAKWLNVHGEPFDIMVPGEHVLLQIPKGSGKDLEIRGHLEYLPEGDFKKDCHTYYFTHFSLSGKWTGAGKEGIDVEMGVGLRETRHIPVGYGIKIGDTYWDVLKMKNENTTLAQVNKNSALAVCTADLEDTNELCPRARSHTSFVIAMPTKHDSQPVRVLVTRWMAGPVQSYMDLEITGLTKKMKKIGGLLGEDDHSKVDIIPEGCSEYKGGLPELPDCTVQPTVGVVRDFCVPHHCPYED